MSNVVVFPGDTTLPIPRERVLDGAKENLHETLPMLVIGYDKNQVLYVASNQTNAGEVLVLLEMAKQGLLEQLK